MCLRVVKVLIIVSAWVVLRLYRWMPRYMYAQVCVMYEWDVCNIMSQCLGTAQKCYNFCIRVSNKTAQVLLNKTRVNAQVLVWVLLNAVCYGPEMKHTWRFWMSIVTHEKIRGESFLAREGLSSFKNSSTYHTPCYSSWTYDWHTSSTMIVQISCTSEWYTSSLKLSSSHQMLYRQAKEDSGRIFSSKRGM